ncbi:hypothetical protein BASA62_003725 [Batrachochytrium salamandrivorans]|nr:hypothetical protein BASA62_003725 [Batrachochytrium salamandrivorans]
MKLAIAYTTILFAMMAAQAAVLSVAPVTDVNLVKRTPNGDEDDEQNPMADQPGLAPTPQIPFTEIEEGQMKSLYGALLGKVDRLKRLISTKQLEISKCKALISRLEQECKRKTSSACTRANAEIALLKEKLAELENQLEAATEKYRRDLQKCRDITRAKRENHFSHLRSQYLQDHSGEGV